MDNELELRMAHASGNMDAVGRITRRDNPNHDDKGQFASGEGSGTSKGVGGYGMKKTSMPTTSDKPKTEAQKAAIEKTRLEKQHATMAKAFHKTGGVAKHGSFESFVKQTDPVHAKEILAVEAQKHI